MDNDSEAILENLLSNCNEQEISNNIDLDFLLDFEPPAVKSAASQENAIEKDRAQTTGGLAASNTSKNITKIFNNTISVVDRTNNVSDLKKLLHEAMIKNEKAVSRIAQYRNRMLSIKKSMVTSESYEQIKSQYGALQEKHDRFVNEMQIRCQTAWALVKKKEEEIARILKQEKPKKKSPEKSNNNTKVKNLEYKVLLVREKEIETKTRLMEELQVKEECIQRLREETRSLHDKLDRAQSEMQHKEQNVRTLTEENRSLRDSRLNRLRSVSETSIKSGQDESQLLENREEVVLKENDCDVQLPDLNLIPSPSEQSITEAEVEEDTQTKEKQKRDETITELTEENKTLRNQLEQLQLELRQEQETIEDTRTLREQLTQLRLELDKMTNTAREGLKMEDDYVCMILEQNKRIPNVLSPFKNEETETNEDQTRTSDAPQSETEANTDDTQSKMSLKLYGKLELETTNVSPHQFREMFVEIMDKYTKDEMLAKSKVGMKETGTQTDPYDSRHLNNGSEFVEIARYENLNVEVPLPPPPPTIHISDEQWSIDSGYDDCESVHSLRSVPSVNEEQVRKEIQIPQPNGGTKRKQRTPSVKNDGEQSTKTKGVPTVKRRKVTKSKQSDHKEMERKRTLELFGSDCESIDSEPEVESVKKRPLKIESPPRKLIGSGNGGGGVGTRKSPRLLNKLLKLKSKNAKNQVNLQATQTTTSNGAPELDKCCDKKSIAVDKTRTASETTNNQPVESNDTLINQILNDMTRNTRKRDAPIESQTKPKETTHNRDLNPLEIRSDLQELVSENHPHTNYASVSSPRQHQKQLTDEEANSYLGNLFNFPYKSEVRLQTVKAFISQSSEFICRKIIERVMEDVHSKVERTTIAEEPALTSTQKALFWLILILERLKPGLILQQFLLEAEALILSLRTVSNISPIARLHLAVCKSQRYMGRIRSLMNDALYCMGDLAVPYIYTVVTSWISVIPQKNHPSFNSLLVRPVVEIIRLKTCKDEGYHLMHLRQLLFQFHGYSAENDDPKALLRELFEEFLVNESDAYKSSIVMFCVNVDSKFVFEEIDAYLKPQLCNSKDLKRMCAVIMLIGLIVQTLFGKETKRCQSLLEWLKNFQNVPCVETQQAISVVLKQMEGG